MLPDDRRVKSWFGICLKWLFISILFISLFIYTTVMPGNSYKGPFQPLSEKEILIRDNIKRHVAKLGGEIGERNVWRSSRLEESAVYIEECFRNAGYEPAGQEYEVMGVKARNIEAELAGTSAREEIVIVGAHYDSVMGSPGANDNASGVAAVIEAARLLAGEKLPRTVRFVAFVNEEPPFYYTDEMGSREYAARSRARGEKIAAMFSLETIGCYSNEPGSQHYPFPMNFFYPDKANFIAFVSNMACKDLLNRSIASFRSHTKFPSEGASVPGWITGISWSDHWSFWKEGYPAIMITDTALFRYSHYHTAEDTPEKLEYESTARVVGGIADMIADIAGRTL